MQNGQTEQKQGFRLVFVCPMAYKGTSVARFVRSIKLEILNNLRFFIV